MATIKQTMKTKEALILGMIAHLNGSKIQLLKE